MKSFIQFITEQYFRKHWGFIDLIAGDGTKHTTHPELATGELKINTVSAAMAKGYPQIRKNNSQYGTKDMFYEIDVRGLDPKYAEKLRSTYRLH